jgi:hypothetical protein
LPLRICLAIVLELMAAGRSNAAIADALLLAYLASR